MHPRNHTRESCTLLFSDTHIMKEFTLGFVCASARVYERCFEIIWIRFQQWEPSHLLVLGFRAFRPLESKVLCRNDLSMSLIVYRCVYQNDIFSVAVPNYASSILWSSCGYQRNSLCKCSSNKRNSEAETSIGITSYGFEIELFQKWHKQILHLCSL